MLKNLQNAWFLPGVTKPATRDFLSVVTVVVSPTSRNYSVKYFQ